MKKNSKSETQNPEPQTLTSEIPPNPLAAEYCSLLEATNELGKLIVTPFPLELPKQIARLEDVRRTHRRVSGLSVRCVTATAWKDSTKEDFDTWKGELEGWEPEKILLSIPDWKAWESMKEDALSGFKPYAIRRLLVEHGLLWEPASKPRTEKTPGNPWGVTLKSFRAWVKTQTRNNLDRWARLVPNVDKIPTNSDELGKLEAAYDVLERLGL